MNITFSHSVDAVIDNFPPVLAKKFLPDWYKNLEQIGQDSEASIKNCIPVQDMATSGYIIRNSFEFELKAETANEIESCPFRANNESYIKHHTHYQCPIEIEGIKKDYFKINHGWSIKTPPGYSCLFLQPFYFFNENFQLLPAIVDTDSYNSPVLFPGYLKTNKIVSVQPGDPLMQVIPFKRDNWTIQIEKINPGFTKFDFWIRKKLDNIYKKNFHSKKKYN